MLNYIESSKSVGYSPNALFVFEKVDPSVGARGGVPEKPDWEERVVE
jgi:hypothetical protein